MRTVRFAALAAICLTVLFILLFDRAKHDPALSAGNPFADDPYDGVGSFAVQLALAGALIGSIRAFRPGVPGEPTGNRTTYTLRALSVSQMSIVVTMVADLLALVRAPASVSTPPAYGPLALSTGGMLLLASASCGLIIHAGRRAEVCSENPLVQKQMVPFLVLLILLGRYPAAWKGSIVGAICAAAAGIVFLFLSVALLSRAMFPCPDLPERDLLEDLRGVFALFVPRLGRPDRLRAFILKKEWLLAVAAALFLGLLLALVQIYGEGGPPAPGRTILVIGVFVALETSGILIGYALFRKFLGVFSFRRPV